MIVLFFVFLRESEASELHWVFMALVSQWVEVFLLYFYYDSHPFDLVCLDNYLGPCNYLDLYIYLYLCLYIYLRLDPYIYRNLYLYIGRHLYPCVGDLFRGVFSSYAISICDGMRITCCCFYCVFSCVYAYFYVFYHPVI